MLGQFHWLSIFSVFISRIYLLWGQRFQIRFEGNFLPLRPPVSAALRRTLRLYDRVVHWAELLYRSVCCGWSISLCIGLLCELRWMGVGWEWEWEWVRTVVIRYVITPLFLLGHHGWRISSSLLGRYIITQTRHNEVYLCETSAHRYVFNDMTTAERLH